MSIMNTILSKYGQIRSDLYSILGSHQMVNCSTPAGAVDVEHSIVRDKQVIPAYFYLLKI